MRFMFPLAFAVFLALSTAVHANPPPRTGGMYDKTLIVRSGIDDFGISLGQWVACVEETLERAVKNGDRPPPATDIEFEDKGNRATLMLPGTNKVVYFDFVGLQDYALMRKMRIGSLAESRPNQLLRIAITLGAACQ